MTIDQLKAMIATPSGQDDLLNAVNQALDSKAAALAENEANAVAVAALNAAHTTALDAKDADKTATLEAAAAAATTVQAEAVAAAVAPLNATIAALQAKVNDLLVQISGSAGQFHFTLTPLELAALTSEATSLGISVQELINDEKGFDAAALASKHKIGMLGQALQAWPILAADQRAFVLDKLGRPYLSALTIPDQVNELNTQRTIDDFNKLSEADMNAIITTLGL